MLGSVSIFQISFEPQKDINNECPSKEIQFNCLLFDRNS